MVIIINVVFVFALSNLYAKRLELHVVNKVKLVTSV